MSVDFVRHLIEHAALVPLKGTRLFLGNLTTAQRNTLPAGNWIIYNITTNQFEFYQAGAWIAIAVLGGHGATHEPGGIDEVNDIDILNTGVLLSVHGVARHVLGIDPITHGQLVGIGPNDHHAQLHAATHLIGAGDALSVGTPTAIGVANADGVATNFVRRDHIHAHGNLSGLVVPAHAHADLSGIGPNDHHAQLHAATHLVGAGDPLSVGTPVAIGTANADGVAANLVRRDHVHEHPNLPTLPNAHHNECWRMFYDLTKVAAETEFNLTGLDLNTHRVYEIYATLKTPAILNNSFYIYFNGDRVNANYYTQYLMADGAVVSSARVNAPYFAWLAGQAALDTLVVNLSVMMDPDGYVRWLQKILCRNEGVNLQLIWYSGVYTVPQANVTRIDIVSDNVNGIGIGSKCILLGIIS